MRVKETAAQYSHYLAAALIIIQPIMDVASYWLTFAGVSNTVTLLIRMLVFTFALVTAFSVSDRKVIYYAAVSVAFLLYLGHVFACLQTGSFSDPVGDLTNYVRVVQLPFLTIAMISFMNKNSRAFSWLAGGAVVAFCIIIAVEAISTLTGTDPHTYSSGIGLIGWFNNTNSQSAILCMISPIVVLWQYRSGDRRFIPFIVSSAVCCLSMYLFGTRLAYMGVFALTVGMGLMIILLNRKDWKYGAVLLGLAVVFVFLWPVSPAARNLGLNDTIQTDRQNIINEELQNNREELDIIIEKLQEITDENGDGTEEPPVVSDDESKLVVEQLTPIYERHVGDFVKRFGAEKTMEMFNYTLDVRKFASVRAKKLMFAEMLMDDSPSSARWFGIELSRFTFEGTIYDVENDFHGVYYLYGITGLAIIILFFASFAVFIAYALVKDFRKNFTIEAVSFGIALVMGLVHAYFTAGVLRRPNASIYLSFILAGVYYLIFIREKQKNDRKGSAS